MLTNDQATTIAKRKLNTVEKCFSFPAQVDFGKGAMRAIVLSFTQDYRSRVNDREALVKECGDAWHTQTGIAMPDVIESFVRDILAELGLADGDDAVAERLKNRA